MPNNNPWYQQSLLELSNHSSEDIHSLLTLASALKHAKRQGSEQRYLQGKNIALIFEKTSTRTRTAFEVACFDQGANPTYLDSNTTQLGDKESVADTAQVLARLYDAIEYRGFAQKTVETLAHYAKVPVYNGLTDQSHPTQMLADLLTMQEHSGKTLANLRYAYLGDARNNTAHSLLLTAARVGSDIRISAPKALQPDPKIIQQAQQLAQQSGAKILISEAIEPCVLDCDFIHTDIWVSMGESKQAWQERIQLLLPYRITQDILKASQREDIKFMHCLPAYHDRNTPTGEAFYQSHGMIGIEVSDDVFTSPASIVFDQAENRMHTIKALLVATLCPQLPQL